MGVRQREEKRALSDVARRPTPPSLKQSTLLIQHKKQQLPKPDVVTTPEFIKEALRDAVQDFEQCLQRSKDDRLLQPKTSTPKVKMFDLIEDSKCAKFNTFPRSLSSPEDNQQQQQTSTYKMFRQSSNSSLSSTSSNSEAVLAGLPSSVPATRDYSESIASITSEMSTHTLKNIREQMARSLFKLKEYERQVEAIPVMQVKLSVLKEEKRLLMLKLKQRELQMRRERGELMGESDVAIDYDTEDGEDYDHDGDCKVYFESSRARSESPYARGLMVNPEDFPSVLRKKRSASCGYNSDSDIMTPMTERRYFESGDHSRVPLRTRLLAKSTARQNLSTTHLEKAEVYRQQHQQKHQQEHQQEQRPPEKKREVKEVGVNTDKLPEPPPRPASPPRVAKVRTRDRSVNTDPPPRSPPPPRKASHGTNTTNVRSVSKGVETVLKMAAVVTKEEAEARVREDVFRTEEEIMGCPLLQKAMAKVEQEALGLKPEEEEKKKVSTGRDFGCQGWMGLTVVFAFVLI